MRAENLIAFQARVVTDADLQQKVAAIHQSAAREFAEKIAALSLEARTPFTAEEFLAPHDLTDDQLNGVVGGSSSPSSGGFLESLIPSSPAFRAANEMMIAQLRASNLWGGNPPNGV